MIRYRIYSVHGLGAIDVANICFLTGLTFWLGNLTALGLSMLYEPDAVSLIDYLPPVLNRWLAAALLVGGGRLCGLDLAGPARIRPSRWPVRPAVRPHGRCCRS